MSTISMNPDAVEAMAGGMSQMSQSISAVGKMLQALIAVLHATALVSFGATEAQAQVLESFLPVIEQAATVLGEISEGTTAAVNNYHEVVEAGAQALSD